MNEIKKTIQTKMDPVIKLGSYEVFSELTEK